MLCLDSFITKECFHYSILSLVTFFKIKKNLRCIVSVLFVLIFIMYWSLHVGNNFVGYLCSLNVLLINKDSHYNRDSH